MMLMPDKKKIVSIILERIGGSPKGRGPYPKEKTEGVDEDVSIALHDAMSKFLKAIENKDVDNMVNYLKDFVYMCSEEEPSEHKEME